MIEVVAGIIERKGMIHCFKKGAGKFDYLSHKFEFPGGKVEAGEDLGEALRRELKEEIEADVEVGQYLTGVDYEYPDFAIRLHFFHCKCSDPIETLTEHVELVLLPATRLNELEWLPADQPAVDLLVSQAS